MQMCESVTQAMVDHAMADMLYLVDQHTDTYGNPATHSLWSRMLSSPSLPAHFINLYCLCVVTVLTYLHPHLFAVKTHALCCALNAHKAFLQ